MEGQEKEIGMLREEVEYWKGRFAESNMRAMEEHDKYVELVRRNAINNREQPENSPAVLRSKLSRAYAEKSRLEKKLSRLQGSYSPGEVYRLEAALMELREERKKNDRLQREVMALRARAEEQAAEAETMAKGKRTYKKEITPDQIGKMLEAGMNVTQIAEALGICRNTVYDRKKKLESENGN